MDQEEAADEQLEKAQFYAPQQMGPVWDLLKEAYGVLENDDKLSQIDEILTQIRQEQLRQAIEGQSGSGSQNQSIDLGNINLDDMVKVTEDGEPVEGSDADGEASAGEAEAPAEGTGDAEGEESPAEGE